MFEDFNVVEIQYPFDDENRYIFDSNKLEFVGGVVRVRPTDETDPTDYTETFSNPADYEHDNTKIDVSVGTAKLKSDWRFGETFVTHQDGDGVPEYHKGGTITSIIASGGANWNAVNKKYGTHSLNINTAGSRLEYLFEEGSELEFSEDGQSGSIGMFLAFKIVGQVGFIFDIRNRAGSHNYRILCYWNTTNFSLFVYNSIGTQVLFYESNNIPAPTPNVFYHLFVTFRLDEFNSANTVAKIYWDTINYGDKAYNTRGYGVQANGAHDILTLGDPSLALPPGMPGSTQAASIYIDEFLVYDSYRDNLDYGLPYYHYHDQAAAQTLDVRNDLWGDPTDTGNVKVHEIFRDELTGDPLGFHGLVSFTDIATVNLTPPENVRIVGYVMANNYTGPGGEPTSTFYYWDTVSLSWEVYTGFAFLGDGTPNINLASEINANLDTFPDVEEDKCLLVKAIFFGFDFINSAVLDEWTRTCTFNAYWTDGPTLELKEDYGFEYDQITLMTSATFFPTNTNIKMQISGTFGAIWYYWNGTGWTITSTQFSTLTDIANNIIPPDPFPQGNFTFKLQFNALPDSTPSITNLTFTYSIPINPDPQYVLNQNEALANYEFENDDGYIYDSSKIVMDEPIGELKLRDQGGGVYPISEIIIFPLVSPGDIVQWRRIYVDDTLPANTGQSFEVQFSNDNGNNWGVDYPQYNDDNWVTYNSSFEQLFQEYHRPNGNGTDRLKIRMTLTSDGTATPTITNVQVDYFQWGAYDTTPYTPILITNKADVLEVAANPKLKISDVSDMSIRLAESALQDFYKEQSSSIEMILAERPDLRDSMELAAIDLCLDALVFAKKLPAPARSVFSVSADRMSKTYDPAVQNALLSSTSIKSYRDRGILTMISVWRQFRSKKDEFTHTPKRFHKASDRTVYQYTPYLSKYNGGYWW